MNELLSVGADSLILGLATLLGLYMAANIGANDLANAMGTSVGSGALTMRQAVIVASIFDVSGAILAGGQVTNTIRKGMIDPSLLADSPEKLLLGMFAALLAAGIWVHFATHFGLPVSTTHSIVGAVVGFGVLAVGFWAVSWGKVGTIVLSWVISPLSGAILGGLIFYIVYKKILSADMPYRSAQIYAPWLLSVIFLVLILSVLFKGLKNLHLDLGFFESFIIALPISLVAGFAGKMLLSRLGGEGCRWIRGNESEKVECVFAYLQIMTACYVAFAHGANDVANAVGPLAAIYSVVKTKTVVMQVAVPFWMLAIGGLAVGGGLLAFGAKVMQTIGKKITEITPVRGFSAEFGAATTILICSRLGLPVSTTHVLVGSVVGVGFMRGMGVLDLRVVRNILYSWFITLPFTIVLSMIFYKVFEWVLL
ncbi:MAG: inorganic phosphate transporter [Deltaproteobacteria bacterium]|nr:inorganic phosphate transporter [Deltaproteobacteria bacterium]